MHVICELCSTHILYPQDHGIKLYDNIAFKNKTNKAIAWGLFNIFSFIGPPKILQTDNGTEMLGHADSSKSTQEVVLEEVVVVVVVVGVVMVLLPYTTTLTITHSPSPIHSPLPPLTIIHSPSPTHHTHSSPLH
jgi:hypothetical protein